MITTSDEILIRYLFGELPESEQVGLEERYFNDTQTLQHLVRLENDLVDDYARGKLSPELRSRFERAYLSNPNRAARVKFGQVLTSKLDQTTVSPVGTQSSVTTASWWQRLSSSMTSTQRALAFSMAIALLLVSTATVFLWIQTRHLQQELATAQAQQNDQEQHAREIQQQLNDERSKTEQLTAELSRSGTSPQPGSAETPPSAIASLVLMVTGVRGSEQGEAPKLVIKKETQKIHLELKLRDNEYKSYDMVLQSVGGKQIYSRLNIKPTSARSGASFSITLSASNIATGDYLLNLKGRTAAGDLDDVSQSLFHVEKAR